MLKKSVFIILFFVYNPFLFSQINITKDLKDIYKSYSKELSKINAKKNPFEYQQLKEIEQSKKIVKLQNLYSTVRNTDVLLANKFLWIFMEDKLEIPEHFAKEEFIKIDELQTKEFLEKYNPEIQKIRNEVLKNFPTEYFGDENFYRTILHFGLDIDGKLKFIEGKGANEEYNFVAALLLYSLNIGITPPIFGGSKVYSFFNLPITLKFE